MNLFDKQFKYFCQNYTETASKPGSLPKYYEMQNYRICCDPLGFRGSISLQTPSKGKQELTPRTQGFDNPRYFKPFSNKDFLTGIAQLIVDYREGEIEMIAPDDAGAGGGKGGEEQDDLPEDWQSRPVKYLTSKQGFDLM